jgi:hypothetical protein
MIKLNFVRFLNNDVRVKIKFEEYKSLHKILSRLDEQLVFEWVKNGYDCQGIVEILPLDKQEWVKATQLKLINKYLDIDTETDTILLSEGNLSRKIFASYYASTYFSSVLFAKLDKKDYKKAIWKIIERMINNDKK